ncbi:MAG: BatD family protein [candidate division Zixibacteria bacterium]|nr:BatD family protein [candidate division Zixibacteria bacterium]
MKVRLTHICVLLVIVVLSTWAVSQASDDVQVKVSLNRDRIGLDEQALLQVEVSGTARNLPAPDMPSLPTFEVYSQGRSSNISIVNGQMSSSVTYQYLLLPRKAGIFPIDRIAVVYNNRRYRGNSVELTVLNQGTSAPAELDDRAADDDGNSRDYFLEAVVDKRNPYVNEQVTLTLKFYIAVKNYSDLKLGEPSTTGFWTEILGNKAPYFQRINNRRYKVIERKYALFPTQTGKLTIGRAKINTTVAAKRRRTRDPFDAFNFNGIFSHGMEITTRSRPVAVNVRPLPREGRPTDFTGTIGDFSIHVSANKTQVEVNQPVTVIISIRGMGNVKSVAEPMFPELDDFRIYTSSTNEKMSNSDDKIRGTKIFEKVFIPGIPGNLEIPSLTFNYFDPRREKYRTISTKPISITVTKPEGYVASAEVPFASPDMTISSQAHDIRYIKQDMGSLRPTGQNRLFTPLYIVVNGLPIIILAGSVLIRRRRERLAGDAGYARARGAAKMARKRLAKASSLAHVDQVSEFYAEIYQTLTSYIADKLNISPHGLTTDHIAELLRAQSADERLIEDVLKIIGACDFARFAPTSLGQQDIDRSLSEAEEVMIRIEGVRFA